MAHDARTGDKGYKEFRGAESPADDIDKARESIRSEHMAPEARLRKRAPKKFTESFLSLCTVVTSLVAIGGLLFTIFQFDKTMKAQRHSTAEAAVGQFIAQVTELRTQENLTRSNVDNGAEISDRSSNLLGTIIWNSPEGCPRENTLSYSLLDSFIVSRAQMLIDGEETGRFVGDILRFLTANQYGKFIGKKPCRGGPRVSIAGLALVDSRLTQASVKEVFLNCVEFEEGKFENVRFMDGSFDHIILDHSTLMSVDFTDSILSAVDFTNSELRGKFIFDNATLISVNFSGTSLYGDKPEDLSISFKGAVIANSNLKPLNKKGVISDELYEIFAEQLTEAESLWNTQMDDQVVTILKEKMNAIDVEKYRIHAKEDEAYNRLVDNKPKNYADEEMPELQWEWNDHCDVQQRRDRRFNILPGDSLHVVQAFFQP